MGCFAVSRGKLPDLAAAQQKWTGFADFRNLPQALRSLHYQAMWIDAHNHLQDSRLGAAGPVVAAMRLVGIDGCVVNATCEEDWEIVAKVAHANVGWALPAFGIHPWKADQAQVGWVGRLKDQLEMNPLASVGECGLDQWITAPSLKLQKPVFEAQLRLAREMERPMTIHCLKAWGALFDSFKKVPPPSRFLLHSFSGSIETAQRLMPLGAYFSFSGYFLHERKAAVVEVFQRLPLDRILLETDAPDMLPPSAFVRHPLEKALNHPANLASIGEALAGVLGMPVEELAQITKENAQRCFGF